MLVHLRSAIRAGEGLISERTDLEISGREIAMVLSRGTLADALGQGQFCCENV